MPFTPVSLVPLDDNQKKTLLAGAASPTQIYAISFRLSGGPVQEWANTFQSAWYSANNNNSARVAGTNLELHSTIDGIPEAVVKIKAAISVANTRFVETQKLKAENEAAQKKKSDDAKAAAQAALKSALDKIEY